MHNKGNFVSQSFSTVCKVITTYEKKRQHYRNSLIMLKPKIADLKNLQKTCFNVIFNLCKSKHGRSIVHITKT